MTRPLTPLRLARVLLAALLALPVLPAQAETWRVDLIVFRFLGGIDEQGRLAQAPSLLNAIELDDVAALSAAGITVLPDAEFALAGQWDKLKSSPQFRPLIRIAWTQNDPPPENGPRLRLIAGNKLKVKEEELLPPEPVPAPGLLPDKWPQSPRVRPSSEGLGEREFNEIDGTVALHLGRFLHLDAAMIFTAADERPQSWMLSESRKMRSDEAHHLDSPRLGIIAKVVKWGPGLTPTVPAATP